MISLINKDKIKKLKNKLINFIKDKPQTYKRLFLREEKVENKKIKKDFLAVLKDLNLIRIEKGFIIPNVRINLIKDKVLVCTDLCSYKKEDQVFPIHTEQVFLIDNLKIKKEDIVLDLGTGSGIIAIFIAMTAKRVYASEINLRAIEFSKFNAILNNVEEKIKFVKSDWFNEFKDMKFDLIVSNPPFEPVPKGLKHFYHSAAGEDGLDIIRKLLPQFKKYLNPEGRFQAVSYSISDKNLLLEKLIKKIKGEKEIIILPQFVPLQDFMEKYPLTKKQESFYENKKLYLVVMNIFPSNLSKLAIIKVSDKDAKKYGDIVFPLGLNERGPTIISDLELLKKIQKIQADIKSKSPQNLPLKEVPWSGIAPTLIDGKPSKRLMIIVVARGCAWAKKGSGPCTMCNFWSVCSEKASNKQIIELFEKEINKYNFKKEEIEEIDIFNSGSFLNDTEIPEEVRVEIMKIISDIKSIKKVMIESRSEYINEQKLKELKKILGKKELEVAIGLESSDDFVRNILINKGSNLKSFEKAAKIIKKSRTTLFAYALVKPPFLTEKEALKDTINTIKYVFSIGKKLNLKTKVALEPVFIKPHTLVHELYKKEMYSHVWLWSMIVILKQTSKLGNIQVGLSSEGMEWNEMPRNCEKCTKKIINLLLEYNKNPDLSLFRNLNCECKEEWKKLFRGNPIPIKIKVENYLKSD